MVPGPGVHCYELLFCGTCIFLLAYVSTSEQEALFTCDTGWLFVFGAVVG